MGDSPNVAYGTWALLNESGRQVATGTWSVRKTNKRWEGAWHARLQSGLDLEGTWTAHSAIISASSMGALFDLGMSNIVRGTWRHGRDKTGNWAIRTYPE